jgi:hypothetical protein
MDNAYATNVSQICLPTNYFALVMTIGAGIILFCLWQVREMTIRHHNQLDDMIANSQHMPESPHSSPHPPPSSPSLSPSVFASSGMSPSDLVSLSYQRMRDPLTPPLKSYPPYLSPYPLPLAPSINIPSRGEIGPFQQLGYCYRANQPDHMFPLFGRPTYSAKWEYYVVHPQNSIKIPINTKNDWEISNDDDIHIRGFPGSFKVNLYENDQPRYLPF